MRLATLNLFNNPHGRWDDREPLVIAQAAALDADVYCFQEVAARSGQLERLLDGLGDAYVAVPFENPDPESVKSLAVVTRFAVVEHDACTSLEQGDIALRVRLEAADATPADVVTTHFRFDPSPSGSECRRRQAGQLLAWLGHHDGAVVLAGDFNSSPDGLAVAALKTRFRSAYEAVHGAEPAATQPTPLFHAIDPAKAFGIDAPPAIRDVAIDYVFVAGPVDVVDCALAWTTPAAGEPNLYPSDHFGLVATLELR